MPVPINKDLYNKVKKIADLVYEKPSAYKSMWIQKMYKKYDGEYEEDGKEAKLKRWMEEKWININPLLNKSGYKTYRPTIRINEQTPKTISEIPIKRLKEQYNLKQKIKGNKNLPKF